MSNWANGAGTFTAQFPPTTPPAPPPLSGGYSTSVSLPLASVACTETCVYASDGDCDDGGSGSEFSVCTLGTDCTDCGQRQTLDAYLSSPSEVLSLQAQCDQAAIQTMSGAICRMVFEQVSDITVARSTEDTSTIDALSDTLAADACRQAQACQVAVTSATPMCCQELCAVPSYTSDGYCDDGGTGSEYSLCIEGTDCADCGNRCTPTAPPSSPSSPGTPLCKLGRSPSLVVTARAPL